MPRPLVYWYTGGLVDDHEVHILIKNIQRPRDRRDTGCPLRVGQPHGERLARLGDEPGVDPLAVYQDAVF